MLLLEYRYYTIIRAILCKERAARNFGDKILVRVGSKSVSVVYGFENTCVRRGQTFKSAADRLRGPCDGRCRKLIDEIIRRSIVHPFRTTRGILKIFVRVLSRAPRLEGRGLGTRVSVYKVCGIRFPAVATEIFSPRSRESGLPDASRP